jgi:non-lysosomal glucosylceramidase
MALAAISPGVMTHRVNWIPTSWRNEGLADWWKDFVDDGALDPARSGDQGDSPVGSVCTETLVPAHGEATVSFILTWHFPNRRSWKCPSDQDSLVPEIVGNHYTTLHRDAWDVLAKVVPDLSSLEARTVDFVRTFVESDFPQVVKEAALNNLAHLRTQTCFRTSDGCFFGWEGGHNKRIVSNCLGTSNHVWNYEVTTAFVFGELARSMRETNFLHMMDEDGAIRSRVFLPLRRSREHPLVAADGQLGCLVHLFGEWQRSGDDSWLRSLWPAAKKAMEFCWRKGSWDADGDGVMEGCQHNTLDTEYFGPNPVMAGWYLALSPPANKWLPTSGIQTSQHNVGSCGSEGAHGWMPIFSTAIIMNRR